MTSSKISVVVVAVLILYLFSFGPAYRRARRNWDDSGSRWFEITYCPLIWAGDQISSCGQALEWYAGLWWKASDQS